MIAFDKFRAGVPYDEFLATHGKPADRDRWDRARAAVHLTDVQQKLLASFTRETNLLVLAGAWCGDCAANCPIFDRFAEIAPVLKVRYLDRDVHADVQAELKINGGNRVPVVVFFSEDGHEVGRYGERTLTAYRKMIAQIGGDTCGSGVVTANTFLADVTADWLREVERVQWILRLSPRLRTKHGD
ncbi:MAG: thioredoxin family protein [Fimbriiglobus sp.]